MARQPPTRQGEHQPERLEALLVIALALSLAANGANSLFDDAFAYPFIRQKFVVRLIFVASFLAVGLVAFGWRHSERVSRYALITLVALLLVAGLVVIGIAGIRAA
jgi:hypothetical protein